MKRIAKMIFILIAFLFLIFIAFLIWASMGEESSEKILECPMEKSTVIEEKKIPEKLIVISLNMAYGRGPVDDKGDLRDRKTIISFLDKISEFIISSGAQIVLLQEVDIDSKRTHHINEMRYIAEKAGFPYMAKVMTWENNYVPYPYFQISQHYGYMRSGQCVLSRFPIVKNMRFRLPQPESNSFYYNAFYLNRAIQSVEISIPGNMKSLQIYNVHLEAFDRENRQIHAEILKNLLKEKCRPPCIIAGDFNAVPEQAKMKKGFPDEPDNDMSGDRTIEIVKNIKGFREIISPEEYAADENKFFTFPADAPSRRLDYMFYSEDLRLIQGSIIKSEQIFSDHLPIIARFHMKYME